MALSARPKRFSSPADFRSWLAKHHATARELLLRCRKTSAAEKGVTYSEALDEALCFGWIDGIRRSRDSVSFSVRFTRRKPKSIWSRVNVARVEALIKAGRMTEPGLLVFRIREETRTGLYSFERTAQALSPGYAAELRGTKAAASYFASQPPWYQRTSTFWVMSAKREETQLRRLEILITCSAQGVRIPPLRRPNKRP